MPIAFLHGFNQGWKLGTMARNWLRIEGISLHGKLRDFYLNFDGLKTLIQKYKTVYLE